MHIVRETKRSSACLAPGFCHPGSLVFDIAGGNDEHESIRIPDLESELKEPLPRHMGGPAVKPFVK